MLKFYEIIRILSFPLFRFIIPLMSQVAKNRIDFELSNLVEVCKLSKAEYGFEVSSEGELEQVMCVINHLLDQEKTVEVIYCSESVEHKIKKLSKKYPLQLRTLRMPLLTYKPWIVRQNAYKWMTCHTLFLCRYDFFPELIFYGKEKAKRFYLLSGSSKNYNKKKMLTRMYLEFCYKSFDKIITATDGDFDRFIQAGLSDEMSIRTADLRAVQIQKRIKARDNSIAESFPIFKEFNEKVLSKNSQKCIFGSFWPEESLLFSSLAPEDLFNTSYCIAPHKLGKQDLLEIIHEISRYQLGAYILTNQTTTDQLNQLISEYREHPGVWIFDVKGILCELYGFFNVSYIGGGFGESIHSVLEPYLSGCSTICGPKTERSSEYDYVKSIDADKISSCLEMNQVIGLIRDFSKVQSKNEIVKLPFNISDVFKFLELDAIGGEDVK